MKFGRTFKIYRLKHNFEQVALANRLKIQPTYLSALENDRKKPSLTLIGNFCCILNIPIKEFFNEVFK